MNKYNKTRTFGRLLLKERIERLLSEHILCRKRQITIFRDMMRVVYKMHIAISGEERILYMEREEHISHKQIVSNPDTDESQWLL